MRIVTQAALSVFALALFGRSLAVGDCGGDCDGQGGVTISEILTIVNIALGNADAMDCPQATGTVTVTSASTR